MLTTEEMSKRSGASLRQLQFWAERGYIKTTFSSGAVGGRVRQWDEADVRLARLFAAIGQPKRIRRQIKKQHWAYRYFLFDYHRGLTPKLVLASSDPAAIVQRAVFCGGVRVVDLGE